ncbi:choice-of-anchor M domain-containing protein [Corynebacterium phocae]|uniref:choice-of-anchor M domain-containing protein n=1 Tax=Corynebacterium phocae TaxID=161895 RepID=UPI0009527900|nr:choice-of-anchor M domain-containing protein [Corynebacterium phocae]KAA8726916.1 cell surface protein [Corynebacterium phocae]
MKKHLLRSPAALLAVFVLCLFAPRALAVELQDGHLDVFTVRPSGSGLELLIKEDITGSHVYQSASDVTLRVGQNAYSDATTQVPEIGRATYYLPQSQQPGLLWPGWDTLEVQGAGYSTITFNFQDVRGPGTVYIFETPGFGDVRGVTSSGSLELRAGSQIVQSNPAHRHVNWAFSEPGTYTMTVQAEGNGTTSNTATYTWVVGDGTGGAGAAADSGLNLDWLKDDPTTSAKPKPQANQQPAPAQPPRPQAPAAPAAPAPAAPAAPAAQPRQQTSQQTPRQCTPLLVPMIKDDTTVPATWRNFGELEFHLGNAAVKDLPVAIGPVPKGKVWMIGSTQEPNVPWVGSNNQHASLLEHTQGPVAWELVGFSGPGPMVVYSQGGLGTIVGEEWFRGANNQAQGTHIIPRNSHVHPNWVFGAPGTYQVSIRQIATLKNGQTTAATGTLVFHVGSGAQSGHFDIGASFNPHGNNCDPGLAAAAAIAPAPAADAPAAAPAQSSTAPEAAGTVPDAAGQANGKDASTDVVKASGTPNPNTAPLTLAEKIIKTLPYVILGLGLFVLGAGSTALLSALNKREGK